MCFNQRKTLELRKILEFYKIVILMSCPYYFKNEILHLFITFIYIVFNRFLNVSPFSTKGINNKRMHFKTNQYILKIMKPNIFWKVS